MTIDEYNKYVSDRYKDEYDKGSLCITFDKPVRLVAEDYKSDTEIKELHEIIVTYNSMLDQLVKFIYDHGFITNYKITYLGGRQCELCTELTDIQICRFLPDYESFKHEGKHITLIFKNITFADYYTKACIEDNAFDNSCDVIFENIDFNNVFNCNKFFGEYNSCHSVTLRNIKAPFIRFADCIFYGKFDSITFENTEFPRMKEKDLNDVLRSCEAKQYNLGLLEGKLTIYG